MLSVTLEVVGFACLVVFAFILFWPAAIAVFGVGLIVGAQGVPARRVKKPDA